MVLVKGTAVVSAESIVIMVVMTMLIGAVEMSHDDT